MLANFGFPAPGAPFGAARVAATLVACLDVLWLLRSTPPRSQAVAMATIATIAPGIERASVRLRPGSFVPHRRQYLVRVEWSPHFGHSPPTASGASCRSRAISSL